MHQNEGEGKNARLSASRSCYSLPQPGHWSVYNLTGRGASCVRCPAKASIRQQASIAEGLNYVLTKYRKRTVAR
jgi:hypothetical protein